MGVQKRVTSDKRGQLARKRRSTGTKGKLSERKEQEEGEGEKSSHVMGGRVEQASSFSIRGKKRKKRRESVKPFEEGTEIVQGEGEDLGVKKLKYVGSRGPTYSR